MFQIFTCQFDSHDRDSIIGFCLNKNCELPSQCCLQCMCQQHSNHQVDCKGFLKISQFLKYLIKQAESLESCQVSLLQKVKDVLGNLAKESKKYLEKLTSLNAMFEEYKYYELKNENQFLKQLYSQEQEKKGKYSERFQELIKEFNKLTEEFNNIHQVQESQIFFDNKLSDKSSDQSLEQSHKNQKNKLIGDFRIKQKSIKKHDSGKVLQKINKPSQAKNELQQPLQNCNTDQVKLETRSQNEAFPSKNDKNYEQEFLGYDLQNKRYKNKSKKYYKKKQYNHQKKNKKQGKYLCNYYVYYEPKKPQKQRNQYGSYRIPKQPYEPYIEKYPQSAQSRNYKEFEEQKYIANSKEPIIVKRQVHIVDLQYEQQKLNYNPEPAIENKKKSSSIKILSEYDMTPSQQYEPLYIKPRSNNIQNIQTLNQQEKDEDTQKIPSDHSQQNQIRQKNSNFPSAWSLKYADFLNIEPKQNKQEPSNISQTTPVSKQEQIKRTNQSQAPNQNNFFQYFIDQYFTGKDIFYSDIELKKQQKQQNNKEQFDDFCQRGYNLHCQQQYEKAIECYNKAIKLESDCAQIYYNKGCCLQKIQQYEEAIESYDKAISLNKDFADAFNNKGIVLKKLQKYEPAILCFNNVLKLNNNDEVAHNNKGNCLQALTKYQEAIKCYEKAIQINPVYEEALQNKSIALESQNKQNQAKILYKQDENKARQFNNEGCDLDLMGKYEEAIILYNKALSLNQMYAIAYYNKGRALQSMLQNQEAMLCYGKALFIDPQLEDANYNLGILSKYQ